MLNDVGRDITSPATVVEIIAIARALMRGALAVMSLVTTMAWPFVSIESDKVRACAPVR
jgi:hypothetical protein